MTAISGAEISIANLRATLAGQVIGPEDADYEHARVVFSPMVDRRPAVIVRPLDANDVAHIVSLARESGIELAVRSGGHSAAGHGVSEKGIVLDPLAHEEARGRSRSRKSRYTSEARKSRPSSTTIPCGPKARRINC